MAVYIITSFDHRHQKPVPLKTTISNGKTVKTFTLFQQNTGHSVYDIEQRLEKISKIMTAAKDLHINDYKAHLSAFSANHPGKVYNYFSGEKDHKQLTKALLPEMVKEGGSAWRIINARSSIAYDFVERHGIRLGQLAKYPIYKQDTYTGRSRTVGFNIQGTTEKDPIHHMDHNKTIFIHLDWMSVDMRVISLMSKDPELLKSFEESDPYTYKSNSDAARQKLKTSMLASIYSMNYESQVFDAYPGIRSWMREEIDKAKERQNFKSILDRKFQFDITYGGKERNIRSGFNAMIQGSVAHLMQKCMYQAYSMHPDELIGEMHDSIIIATEPHHVKDRIKIMVDIMKHPFGRDILFPVRVSVGRYWKKWKEVGVYR